MQTERGLERLVGFTDAVVAIAITLLVLPLVESARDVHTSVADFLSSNTTSLFTFALSFVVIAGFWRVQHRRFESVTGYNPPLVWATMLWLFAIVFLPLPTELLGGAVDDDRGAHALYIGTMVLSTVAGLLQEWVIRRSPALRAGLAGSLVPALVTTAIMVLALAASVAVPALGLWPLLLLLLTEPVLRLGRRLAAAGHRHEKTRPGTGRRGGER
jgi:uncharacterized membrane protein